MVANQAVVIGMTQGAALLLLFVVLPFAVAGAVIAFVTWRSRGGPAPVRTSEILRSGDEGQAEVLSVKATGGFLDPRPMVRIRLRVTVPGEPGFELDATQSIPRALLRDLKPGDQVAVRVTSDRSHAAVVLDRGSLPE